MLYVVLVLDDLNVVVCDVLCGQILHLGFSHGWKPKVGVTVLSLAFTTSSRRFRGRR